MITREEAVRLLEEQHAELGTLFEELDPDAFVRRGTMGGGEWSAKDLAAHLGSWEEFSLGVINGFRRGERPTIDELRGSALCPLGIGSLRADACPAPLDPTPTQHRVHPGLSDPVAVSELR